jgi:hypothetical protein
MHVFRNKSFTRFAAKEVIADEVLCDAVNRASTGLVDADLGGSVIKQRLPRAGQGKSGGFRSIVLFRRGEIAVFVYGFAKSDMDNIRPDELRAFRKLAEEIFALNNNALAAAKKNGTITEIACNG